MVPFETQYQKWTEEKEANTKLAAEAQLKASIKQSWDHDLVDNAKITKPVVKISKFGTKK
jgi:hypothetical protein